jgi:hypothetical protein
LEKSSPHPVGTGGNFTNNNVNNGDVEPQHTQTLVQWAECGHRVQQIRSKEASASLQKSIIVGQTKRGGYRSKKPQTQWLPDKKSNHWVCSTMRDIHNACQYGCRDMTKIHRDTMSKIYHS